MKETIKLLKYNNYFNRIIMKAGETANYYDDFVLYTQSLVNFNPNDGVNTEIVLNTNEQGDYVIVVAEDGTTINSRWFVLENERTRNGQAKLSLKRDVIADNFESILRSPCYVEKGTLSANDPLIYNSEGMLFNQIKTDEIMLKDRSATPWIVGYISRDYLKDSEAKEIHGKYNVLQSAAINASDLPWEFTSDPQIVGVTKGYRLTITSGDYIFHISTTYQGQTYSGTSYASE